ncbi:hypothetical protein [Roseibium sp.]|uniref:hypothetical protein n=1 Tax=Roseibium sp. TaxID=1936156 RepID=UPI0026220964|nr:hypothetical protein [Roseibium sp.]
MDDQFGISDENLEPIANGNDFLSGLNDDHKALATQNGWQDPGSVLDGYRALQDQLTGAVMLPDEAASSDEKTAFYQDISKSWTPKNGYQFNMPEALPENFPYDQAFAAEASGWFKEAGLHPSAAQQLHDKWVGKMAEHFGAHEESAQSAARQQAEAAETAHRDLIREYGEPESDAYQNVVAKADRALTHLKATGLDITGWFADKGALTKADANGLQQVADPVAVKLLAFIHDNSFAEDGLAGLTEGSSGADPFASGCLNLKEQSELLVKKPARARQMIMVAGRDPKLFRV